MVNININLKGNGGKASGSFGYVFWGGYKNQILDGLNTILENSKDDKGKEWSGICEALKENNDVAIKLFKTSTEAAGRQEAHMSELVQTALGDTRTLIVSSHIFPFPGALTFNATDEIYTFWPGMICILVLKLGTPVSIDSVWTNEITTPLIQDLITLHKNNIVHRDIKPGNMMFDAATETGPLFTDFGSSIQFVDKREQIVNMYQRAKDSSVFLDMLRFGETFIAGTTTPLISREIQFLTLMHMYFQLAHLKSKAFQLADQNNNIEGTYKEMYEILKQIIDYSMYYNTMLDMEEIQLPSDRPAVTFAPSPFLNYMMTKYEQSGMMLFAQDDVAKFSNPEFQKMLKDMCNIVPKILKAKLKSLAPTNPNSNPWDYIFDRFTKYNENEWNTTKQAMENADKDKIKFYLAYFGMRMMQYNTQQVLMCSDWNALIKTRFMGSLILAKIEDQQKAISEIQDEYSVTIDAELKNESKLNEIYSNFKADELNLFKERHIEYFTKSTANPGGARKKSSPFKLISKPKRTKLHISVDI